MKNSLSPTLSKAVAIGALAASFAVVACSTPTTTNNGNAALQAVFTAEATYDALVLTPMSAYWNLPNCTGSQHLGCSDQAVVVQLKKADTVVSTAFAAAEAIARNNSNANTLTLLTDATTAIAAVERILTQYGIKWGA